MEHVLALLLKILLFLDKDCGDHLVQRLGPRCDEYVFANSVIKVQVTVSFCLALNWILKPESGKSISTTVREQHTNESSSKTKS